MIKMLVSSYGCTSKEEEKYKNHMFKDENPNNLDWNDYWSNYNDEICEIGSEEYWVYVGGYSFDLDMEYRQEQEMKIIDEIQEKLPLGIPQPSQYSIEHYYDDKNGELFRKDLEEQFKPSEMSSEEFWKLYDTGYEHEDYYISEKYYEKLENEMHEPANYNEYDEYDYADIVENKEDLDFYQENKNPIPDSERDIFIGKANQNTMAKDIAVHFMENFNMFQDHEKRLLFVNNFHGGFDTFKLENINGFNWQKYVNNHSYTLDNDKNKIPLNHINSDVLEKQVIKYVDVYKDPEYDKIGFTNGILDISKKQYEFLDFDNNEPIYTKLSIPHKYNPDANGGELKEWLSKKFTDDEVTGLLEYIGYIILEPGHEKHQWLLMIIGIGGSGKSMLAGFIRKAIGDTNTCSLNLKKILGDNRFESANMINKSLALIEEMDGNKLENYAWFKEHTGGAPVTVEEKGKQQVEIRPKDVPHLIVIGNRPTSLENIDDGMTRRLLLLDFTKKVTPEELKNTGFRFSIENSEDCMEWLIYQSIEAYKTMMETTKIPKLQSSEDELMKKLEKHSKSEEMLVRKYFNSTETMDNVRLTKKLFFSLIKILAELPENGVSVKGENSKIWKDVIEEFTGNWENTHRNRRTVNGKQYAHWVDININPDIIEKYTKVCAICGEKTIDEQPCIYGCEEEE